MHQGWEWRWGGPDTREVRLRGRHRRRSRPFTIRLGLANMMDLTRQGFH